jgi:EmrB/QacA subfamily drug resistance transporter
MSTPPRETAAEAGGGFTWTRRHVLALAVLCLASLLDIVDVTVVNVAMPAIKESLHFSEGALAWVVNAYMVPFGGFMLLAGRAGDRFGRRRVLVGGTVLFTVSSLASALAPNAAVMIASRAAEGMSAAFVVPTTLAMLSGVFPAGPARNRAFAVWGGLSAAAGTLGLVAGGLLVSAAGWRWVFLISIPVGAFVIAVALRVLPGSEATSGQTPVSQARGPLRSFDAVGALGATAGASLLAYAVVQTGSHPWGSARTITLLAGAAVLLGYFLVHEQFIAADPLMPLSLWRNRSVAGANLVAALQSSGIFAMFYSSTLYQQQVLGFSALRTGVGYLPLGVSILVAAGLGPVLVPRFGVRFTVAAGALLSAVGLLLLARLQVSGNLATSLILPMVIVGLGAGIVTVPSSVAALAGVPAERSGVASALLNVSRQLGGALGLAVISTLVSATTTHGLAAGHATGAAMTAGFRAGFTVSAVLLAAATAAALVLLREDGRGQNVNLIELQTAGA